MDHGSSCPPVPAEFDALDAALDAALRAASGGADGWQARTRAAVLARVQRQMSRLTAVNLAIVAAEQRAGTWALKGDRDLAAFVGRQSRQGRGAGFATVQQAATLTAMPVVAGALADGPVTPAHLAQLARVTGGSPGLAAHLTTPEGQEQVVGLAGRLDAGEFGKALARQAASLDPAARQRSHDEQRAARYLTIAHTPGGTLIKAQLDSVAGYRFRTAIDALNPRPAQDDHRDEAQRRADALVEMVHRTLTDSATTPGAVAPVQAIVAIREETWVALRAAYGLPEAGSEVGSQTGSGSGPAPGSGLVATGSGSGAAAGSTADVIARLRGVAPVVDETGAAWPASEVALALCDCRLTRAVVSATSTVLDLGMSERRFQRSHWLALLAAGQTTCAVASCTMPLRYTQLHHMDWWYRDDGPTTMANCAPECGFHHDEIHKHDIRVTRRPDGVFEHRWPDGRLYGGSPDEGGPPDEGGGPPDDCGLSGDGGPLDDCGLRGDGGPPGTAPSESPRDLLELLSAVRPAPAAGGVNSV